MKFAHYLLIVLGTVALFSSCKKDDDKNGTPNAYYFKANINGQEYRYDGQILQSGSSFIAHCGGYVTSVANFLEAGGLFIEVDTTASPSEASILALLNDTLYVNDNMYPNATIQFDSTAAYEFSTDALNNNLRTGYVILTDIDPLGLEETGNWNVYAVKGKFKANVGMDGDFRGEATGDFFMRITTNEL